MKGVMALSLLYPTTVKSPDENIPPIPPPIPPGNPEGRWEPPFWLVSVSVSSSVSSLTGRKSSVPLK